MTPTRLSYRFGPLERRGLLGTMSLGQAGALAAGALLAIISLDAAPDASGAMGGIIALAAGVGFAFLPLAGRTFHEWTPVVAGFLGRRGAGSTRFRSSLPRRGFRSGASQRSTVNLPTAELAPRAGELPPALRGVRITQVAYRQRSIGAIADRGGRQLTAVLACRAGSFSLLDPEAQERRLARWGLILSGAASTSISRIGWVERTAPAQGDELARWLARERDPTIPLRGTPIIESYLELIGNTAIVTQEHEILVVVQVDGRGIKDRGRDALSRALVEESERVAQALEAAEVTVLGALGPGQLGRVLRTAFDPFARAELTTLEAADPCREGLAEGNAWPLAADEEWELYRADGALHATYWIGGWPRVEVSPMFMDALLGRSSAVRTVAVTFEPVAPDRSTREVEAAITRDQANRDLRHRFGQSETARQRQLQAATLRREAELAAGHGEVRFAGFVTVSGRDREELRRASAEVLEHAARARLELHRMYGQQAEAFTFTLPLCRGLR